MFRIVWDRFPCNTWKLMSWMHSIAWCCKYMAPKNNSSDILKNSDPVKNMVKTHHFLSSPVKTIFSWSEVSVFRIFQASMVHLFSSRCWIWTFRPCSDEVSKDIQGPLEIPRKNSKDGNEPFTKHWNNLPLPNLERWRLERELRATQRLWNNLPMHVVLGTAFCWFEVRTSNRYHKTDLLDARFHTSCQFKANQLANIDIALDSNILSWITSM